MKQCLKRYDVVLVDFGTNTIDSEQGGIRPAVIIQNDTGNFFSNTTIVLPFSSNISKNPNQPTHTLIKKGRGTGLGRDSIVLGECIRQVSERRIKKFMGTVTCKNDRREIKRVYDANFGEE